MDLNYVYILFFVTVAAVLSSVIVFLPLIVSRLTGTYNPYKEKLSPYECGFNPVDGRPKQFDVKFYLVAILFVIFDLEIALLFPWSINVRALGASGFASVMIFLFVLTLGFVYEWKKGALDWS